jgi:putative flippase GtrA
MKYLLARLHRRRIAFAITGGVAMVLSIAMFTVALAAGVSPYLATVLRLATALPILYVGYSRYMLVDALHAERAELGRTRAELRMLLRVAVAIATSTILKLTIEPVLTTWLLAHFGAGAATIAPLVGDLGYGPLATYLVLNTGTPRIARTKQPA